MSASDKIDKGLRECFDQLTTAEHERLLGLKVSGDSQPRRGIVRTWHSRICSDGKKKPGEMFATMIADHFALSPSKVPRVGFVERILMASAGEMVGDGLLVMRKNGGVRTGLNRSLASLAIGMVW